jgi:hypothetical protein
VAADEVADPYIRNEQDRALGPVPLRLIFAHCINGLPLPVRLGVSGSGAPRPVPDAFRRASPRLPTKVARSAGLGQWLRANSWT